MSFLKMFVALMGSVRIFFGTEPIPSLLLMNGCLEKGLKTLFLFTLFRKALSGVDNDFFWWMILISMYGGIHPFTSIHGGKR